MDFYCNVLSLAKQYKMRIPLCFTMKYLDVNHIAPESSPLPYAEELIALLKENTECIEFGYHGLTHEYKNKPIEFFDTYTNSNVPYNIQRFHIQTSFQIIESLFLSKPEVFVPPGHAWQLGVTDKILSEYGIKYLISVSELKFNERSYRWMDSQFLSFLPRTSVMEIYHADINLDKGVMRRRSDGRLVLINADSAKKAIYPRSLYYNLRHRRKFMSPPIHSYMTHIGNFSNQAMGFWREVLDSLLEREEIHVCHTNVEAEKYYKILRGIA
ncbi:hypothetical protein CLG94_12440 [Candidatus Methylomirabilis limnetica]|uniref:DUF2334 domain-containing protein n=2 Tax=Candidatus Methylomirabilis limnetica TaxID=2033718 RepID=A0A2T4TUV7_9BACT|nr:hypothetical protein CLG94_12440 [Candidatus Methylomirabilis limnetica]